MDFTKRAERLTKKELLAFYKALALPRRIEEKMLILLRQGKISKWFSGIGQEAISVGCTLALKKDEFILPMHRNLGVFTTRDIPLKNLFAQFQGKPSGFTNGRDRSFHFGSIAHHIVGMISHLGPQLAIADGIALAHKLKKEKKVTAVFTGDGGTSEGDFHEALNVAAVWDLPVLFIIENNGYGLSTPSKEQFRCKQFTDKAIGYGIEGVQIDGNNILEVYQTIDKLAKSIRKNPRPILLECMTFRMRGHEEASGTKYVPKKLMEEWAKKDPLRNYEGFLLYEKNIPPETLDRINNEIKEQINTSLEIAYKAEDVSVNTLKEHQDLFMPFTPQVILPSHQTKNMRLVDAISDGLHWALIRHENTIIMGQDIAEYGGVFKITEGFVEEFGKERIRNTPLCESAIVGCGIGLSIKGYKAIVEMQFADFVTCGFNQIVNNLAKLHYRWGQHCDVVIRMPTGAGVAAGPFHSQSNEAWFFHVPGLKIVYPSTPKEAKGLLISAIEDPNPVLFFEHKALYRSIREDVPEEYYTLAIGKADIKTSGDRLTIISYGAAVQWTLEVIEKNAIESVELIDLRSLAPIDYQAVFESVKKTSKALIIHEDNLTGGIGAEIAAQINEHCFTYLDAPVTRLASLDTPIPFNPKLEDNYLPKKDILSKIEALLAY